MDFAGRVDELWDCVIILAEKEDGMPEKKKVHTLFLYTGYVESGSNSCLVMHHEDGFESLELAVKDLAEALIAPYARELKSNTDNKICRCANTAKGKFCPECGKPKEVKAESPKRRNIEKSVLAFIHAIADDVGWMWESIEERGWDGKITKQALSTGVFLIESCAESLLYAAYAGKLNQEDEDGDNFCFNLAANSKEIC
ncbi:hypothetical protein KJ885_05765 [Patescibacteria group bacterium]|nr:hypothetical protein [Patescibacteria group bacterium]